MPFKNQRVLDVHRKHRRNEKRLYGTAIEGTSQDKNEITILFTVFVLTLFLIGNTLNRINVYMAIQTINTEGINYDYFREMIIPIDSKYYENEDYKNSDNSKYDKYDYITLNTLLNQNGYSGAFNILPGNRRVLLRKLYENSSFKELKGYIQAILEDVKKFPVDIQLLKNDKVSYIDSWNYLRSYGGKRKHEGTDLMSADNLPEVIKVLSMTDGIVEKMGWLEKGGYRVGIRGNQGAYFYYAHLSSYAPELKVGDAVKTGDFIGYMGDSGYGTEGTTGMFPVHLHVGIYVETPFGELSVNPYLILKFLEKK
ncbi:MAG: hypothetical protein K0S61_402 [Anaerocolumna sp.]|jgi:murein DD-endopeptidase MepM/ murein hydrolase activator NlpD|nr:hypothetical protein [Anaerocolumna sp.]